MNATSTRPGQLKFAHKVRREADFSFHSQELTPNPTFPIVLCGISVLGPRNGDPSYVERVSIGSSGINKGFFPAGLIRALNTLFVVGLSIP